MEFNKIIEQIMVDKNLSQAEFARKVGIESGQINEWLKGKKKPSYDSLREICKKLNISGDVILGLEEDKIKKD